MGGNQQIKRSRSPSPVQGYWKTSPSKLWGEDWWFSWVLCPVAFMGGAEEDEISLGGVIEYGLPNSNHPETKDLFFLLKPLQGHIVDCCVIFFMLYVLCVELSKPFLN